MIELWGCLQCTDTHQRESLSRMTACISLLPNCSPLKLFCFSPLVCICRNKPGVCYCNDCVIVPPLLRLVRLWFLVQWMKTTINHQMPLTETIDDNKSHCSSGPQQQTWAIYARSLDGIFIKHTVITAGTAEFCCRSPAVLCFGKNKVE